MPHYLKVAEHYADLHDVPARMLAKRCLLRFTSTKVRLLTPEELRGVWTPE